MFLYVSQRSTNSHRIDLICVIESLEMRIPLFVASLLICHVRLHSYILRRLHALIYDLNVLYHYQHWLLLRKPQIPRNIILYGTVAYLSNIEVGRSEYEHEALLYQLFSRL